MKIFEIDNPNLLQDNELQAVTRGKKIIFFPPNITIIPTGGYIPHIKSNITGFIFKYCPTCKQWLSLSQFLKTKYEVDGYKNLCRQCDNKRRRQIYAYKRSIH